MRPILIVATLLVALAACRADDRTDAAPTGGTLVVTTSADADFVLPPLVGGSSGKQRSETIYERLAEIGDDLNTVGDRGFEPRLAQRWDWAADSLSITFHLHPDARWHDGRPVTASDVRFSHRLYTDPEVASPSAALLASIDSVSVRDSLTAVVWFRTRGPEQFYEATHQLFILPEHLLGGIPAAQLRSSPVVRQPVGTGRFRFARWEPGSRFEVVADTANYRGRAKLDRVIWSVSPDPNAAVTRLFAGEADFHETLRIEHIAEIERQPELKVVPYPAMAYGYLQYNLRDPGNRARPHPILADAGVRRALSMAIDRKGIVRNVFDSLAHVAHGPFPSRHFTADTTLSQLPHDVDRAKRILDSLGWRDANGDGIREKAGRPLELTILLPSSSRPRQRIGVLLQEQLKQVGARVNVDALEFATTLERMKNGQFDAVIGAWSTDPSPSGIRQTWMSPGPGGRGVSNFGAYASPVFDALVDSALAAGDQSRSRAYFRRAYQTMLDDAAAVFIYELRLMAGAHQRIQPTRMRADAWWAHLADWHIPPDQRIARDAIGLRTAPQAASATTGRDTASR